MLLSLSVWSTNKDRNKNKIKKNFMYEFLTPCLQYIQYCLRNSCICTCVLTCLRIGVCKCIRGCDVRMCIRIAHIRVCVTKTVHMH